MNTPWTCNAARTASGIAFPGSGRTRWCGAWLVLIAFLPAGCTYSGGVLLSALGFGRGADVEAKFLLTREPLAILIDDPAQRIDWPRTRAYLFDELAQQLLEHEAAPKIVPRQTIEHLHQTVPNFEKRGCREIGELAGAEQVLWLEVRDFLATEDFFDASSAAYVTVSVRVINVKETENRSRVRLWPESPRGHIVSVSMSGSEVVIAKTRDEIAKQLAEGLAGKVAELFYGRRLREFENEE